MLKLCLLMAAILKQTWHGWSLSGQFSKLCPVTLTSIQDGQLQQTYCSMEVVVTGHNFESILPKDHPCHVCFKMAEWFQKRRLTFLKGLIDIR
jgi:hypothetical protein